MQSYTDDQIRAMREFKNAIAEYNNGEITLDEYVKKTRILWKILEKIFEKNINKYK